MRFRAIALLPFLMLASTNALAHKLIDPSEQVSVARSELTVIPAMHWNRINQRPGNSAERWTLDGELLNDVLFFGAIENGETLFREVDRRNRPLPEYSETMLLIDVPALLESSLKIVKGVAVFETVAVDPVEFLGHPGVQFDYTALGGDDIRRKGRAVATIIDGELFMMSYEAPGIYYFEKNIADFDQLVVSAFLN